MTEYPMIPAVKLRVGMTYRDEITKQLRRIEEFELLPNIEKAKSYRMRVDSPNATITGPITGTYEIVSG